MRALLQAIVLATVSLVTLAITPSAVDAQWQRHSSPWYSYPPGPMYSAPGAGTYGHARARLRVRIGLYDNFFMPATITVSPGMRVRWVNFGQQSHTVSSDNGMWDSGELVPGEWFSYTFLQPGIYTYHCEFHAGEMGGTIIVR